MAVCEWDWSNMRWLKREINFFLILLLGMSHGFIILTWRKTTEHAIQAHLVSSPEKNSKLCRLPARFFWLFFGTHKEFTWQNFWKLGILSIQLGTMKQSKNLRQRVCLVRGLTSQILLVSDNARLHTARTTIEALETLKFEVLSHPPYSSDLAPSDYHSFLHLKRDLKGTHFTSDDEVKQAVTSWNKELLNSSLTACVNLFYFGKNVLNDKATMSKNKYVNL